MTPLVVSADGAVVGDGAIADPDSCVARDRTCQLAPIAALLLAGYGGTASAILPGGLGFPSARDGGPVPAESWLFAGALYLLFVAAARRTANPRGLLGFPQTPLMDSPDGAIGRLRRSATATAWREGGYLVRAGCGVGGCRRSLRPGP
jgi:hypothetical protein